jgi:hypothetical protein
MNKKIITALSVFVILVFIGYMIFDSVRSERVAITEVTKVADSLPDAWQVMREFKAEEGSLKAVAVSLSGEIYLGGDSFVSCYNKDLKLIWSLKTDYPVTALACSGNTIFASTMELILVIDSAGNKTDEWGPFEDNAIITSVTANKSYVAFADAGNKMLFILDTKGNVKNMIGQNDGQFVIPSAYFDVVLGPDNAVYVANTGHRRIERRTIDGVVKSYFGEAGLAPGAFCGCCNPAHFVLIPNGFVTAEKGINRIKIVDSNGEFVEFVSSKNRFTPSVPLDLACIDGKTIYAANPDDSKLYIFARKQINER